MNREPESELVAMAIPLLADWIARTKGANANATRSHLLALTSDDIHAGPIEFRVSIQRLQPVGLPSPVLVMHITRMYTSPMITDSKRADALKLAAILLCEALCLPEWEGIYVEDALSAELILQLMTLGYTSATDTRRVTSITPALFKTRPR